MNAGNADENKLKQTLDKIQIFLKTQINQIKAWESHIWSRDKNLMIEIEEKQPKHQNPQKYYVRKSHVKCMKNMN